MQDLKKTLDLCVKHKALTNTSKLSSENYYDVENNYIHFHHVPIDNFIKDKKLEIKEYHYFNFNLENKKLELHTWNEGYHNGNILSYQEKFIDLTEEELQKLIQYFKFNYTLDLKKKLREEVIQELVDKKYDEIWKTTI